LDITLDRLELRHEGFALSADLTISGGSTAIIGPSGGGKSTLMLAIAGFETPFSGRILFDGSDFTTTPPAERPVTLLFQEHNLFPHLTIYQNTALGLRPDLRLNPTQKDQVNAALDRVGLADKGGRYPAELSGGQRQRVALARALLRERPVLMLDEPFAALGPALRAEMLDLVMQIRREQDATLLLVTHNPEDAERIADRAVLVADGVASAPRDMQDMLENPPEALTRYLGKA